MKRSENVRHYKVIIIVAYFGHLPNYFQLWLDSCAYNELVDFLVFTDDRTPFEYPDNVIVEYCTFEEIKKRFTDNYDFDVHLETPYKLCDFKPAYGDVFFDYVRGYDYWGHCDLDMLWGDIMFFLGEAIAEAYDKIMALGHLSLYRNTIENNVLYKRNVLPFMNYKDIFSSGCSYGFDETDSYSINHIFRAEGRRLFYKDIYADIDELSSGMDIVHYDLESNCFNVEKKEQYFSFEDGKVFSHYCENGQWKKREYVYLHFQKRNMKLEITRGDPPFIITNWGFIPMEKNHPESIVSCMKKTSVKKIYMIKKKSILNQVKKRISICIWKVRSLL